MSKTLALEPRLNEKTYGLAASRVYVFDVDRGANKHAVARAVEAQFEVKVTGVRTTNIAGKPKRVLSITGKRMANTDGSRSDFKKAYVTLAEGYGLPFFDAVEEEERKEQATQEKFDKAIAKQSEKDDKAAAKTAKSEAKKEAKAEAKPSAKPADKAKPVSKKATEPAEKPATKDAKSDKSAAKAEPEAEEPKKHGLRAWRGFRLRKKNRGDE